MKKTLAITILCLMFSTTLLSQASRNIPLPKEIEALLPKINVPLPTCVVNQDGSKDIRYQSEEHLYIDLCFNHLGIANLTKCKEFVTMTPRVVIIGHVNDRLTKLGPKICGE